MSSRALQISLVSATLATLVLFVYLRRYEQRMSGGDRVPVLVLRTAVERGQLLEDEMLAMREIPVAYLETRAVHATDRAKVVGLPLATALEPAQGLLWTDLALAGRARDLSSLVQPGKRAVTLLVRGAFDGRDHALIRPGDYVDVLVNLSDGTGRGVERRGSRVLLQRILVLAVGAQTVAAPAGRGSAGGNPLTLSLEVQQAQKLSLAVERGSISVVLRNPEDTQILEDPPRVVASMLSDDADALPGDSRAHPSTMPVPIFGAR